MNSKPDKDCEERGDIILISEIIANSIYWQEICNQNLLNFGFDFDDITTGHRGGKFQYVTTG